MLTFKYGVDQMDDYIHFVDCMIPGNGFVPHGELLYGVDVINGEQTIVTFFEDIGMQHTCEIIDRKGVTVDKLTELIRVDMPAGSNVKIPDVLVSYVRQTGDEVYYDGRHYHWATYMYGKFDGRNRINVYNGKLRTFDRFDTQECLYCVMEGAPRIVGSQSYTDLVELKERDSGSYYAGSSGLEVYVPTVCSVNIPRLIKQDMREHGYEDALFVPIHVDGKWDIKSQMEETSMAQVTYMYGKFNGRNRVKFHNMELPAKEFYDTQEGIYRIVDGEIAGYYGAQCTYSTKNTVERDGKVYLEDLKLQVAVPAGYAVEFPQSVHYAMRACGDSEALFIPIRVDGSKDYAEGGMTVPRQNAIRKAFEECKHLTGPGRFAALMSLLVKTDAEVYCLGDMVDRHTLDCYGVNISCTYGDPKPSEFKKYRMLSRGGEALLQAYEEGGSQVIALDSDYIEDGSRVIILDRPVPPGTKVQTSLSVSMGDVLLIEVPNEDTGSLDILPELQRLSTDENYRRQVSSDIRKVFKQLPPAMRKEDEAISQVIKLAVSLIRE